MVISNESGCTSFLKIILKSFTKSVFTTFELYLHNTFPPTISSIVPTSNIAHYIKSDKEITKSF